MRKIFTAWKLTMKAKKEKGLFELASYLFVSAAVVLVLVVVAGLALGLVVYPFSAALGTSIASVAGLTLLISFFIAVGIAFATMIGSIVWIAVELTRDWADETLASANTSQHQQLQLF